MATLQTLALSSFQSPSLLPSHYHQSFLNYKLHSNCIGEAWQDKQKHALHSISFHLRHKSFLKAYKLQSCCLKWSCETFAKASLKDNQKRITPLSEISDLEKVWTSIESLGSRMLAIILEESYRSITGKKARKLPETSENVNIIFSQPFFLSLYDLYQKHGGIFRLRFGPKSFLIVSDPEIAKHILKDNPKAYSKGVLAEILEFVMGKGLIPADDEIWHARRRAIIPAMHRKYVAEMVNLFGKATARLCNKLEVAASSGEAMEMESLFSRLALDIIGKAVFNYEFDALSNDTGIVKAVYVTLREAEARSIAVIPYWKIPFIEYFSSRQSKVADALNLVNDTVNKLIIICKRKLDEENVKFDEDYINKRDPSILNFLLASGDNISSRQLRDDLVTLLIAGHETSAAVLTWAFYLLAKNPSITAKVQSEVDSVLGDRFPTIEDMKNLKFTSRVISETLRLYPQPPVLIRRSLKEDILGEYSINKGEDIFISVWNLHRSPQLWEDADAFRPERWPLDRPTPNEVTEDYRYLPFGGGPRKCIGEMFATFETITTLAMLVRRFNFELAEGLPPVGMTTGATIHTTSGMNLTFTQRSKHVETSEGGR